jgi:gluconolactonase
MLSRTLVLALLVLLLIFVAHNFAADQSTVADETNEAAAQFRRLVSADAKPQKLASDMKFTEGPVWTDAGGGYLVFSDIPANELKRWDAASGLSTFRTDSNGTNGNTRDRRGRLIHCEQATRRVTRTDKDGTVTVLADRFLKTSKRFNSPNDVVVKSDGTIWFTDPTYGLPSGARSEIGARYVFCLVPDIQLEGDRKMLQMVTHDDDFDQPNGLCFSPDESRLYVADSGKPHHIKVFDVSARSSAVGLVPWELTNGRVFCVIEEGAPDGIRCDRDGNVWSSAGDGVHVFSPDGKLLGKITVPETPANLCFGGKDGRTLFVTARTSLYGIETRTSAAPRARVSSTKR